MNCQDLDPCTIDSCTPATGQCFHTPVTCDDSDVCTADACQPGTGACLHTPIVLAEPGPVQFATSVSFQWPPTGDATHWNAYRGTIPATMLGSRLPGAVYDQVCFENAEADNSASKVSQWAGYTWLIFYKCMANSQSCARASRDSCSLSCSHSVIGKVAIVNLDVHSRIIADIQNCPIIQSVNLRSGCSNGRIHIIAPIEDVIYEDDIFGVFMDSERIIASIEKDTICDEAVNS